jgi:ABC-type Fe3+ transport system substrate-binding protein
MSARKSLVIAVLLLVALVMAALFIPGGADEGDAQLLVLSPHADEIKEEFKRAFADWSEQNLGERVVIKWLDTGGSMSQQQAVMTRFEESPDGIDVDVYFGGGVDPFVLFKQKGYLAPVDLSDEILERIPRTHSGMELYDEDLQWFGACMSGFGIVYSPFVLDKQSMPPPQTWTDLTAPQYFSWVSAADPSDSGSMHMAFEIITQALGWEQGWSTLARICANCESVKPSASDVIMAISTNDVAAGMAIDYYALGAENAGFVLPEGLTVINPDGIGILKGAPNMKYARAFVEFVLSDTGQKLWILKAGAPGGPEQHTLYRLPMVPNFAEQFPQDQVARTEDAFAYDINFEFDSDKSSRRWNILGELWAARFVQPHDGLASAWEEVMQLPDDHPRRQALLAPPLTEEELMEMIPQWRDSPRFRNDVTTRWKTDAAALYERIGGDD